MMLVDMFLVKGEVYVGLSKISTKALINIAEKVGATVEFNNIHSAWVKECGDTKWCSKRRLYNRLDSRSRKQKEKEVIIHGTTESN